MRTRDSESTVKSKLMEAGQRLWSDEKIRSKFLDGTGKFDLKKTTKEVADYVKTISSMARDVISGTYHCTPWKWAVCVATTAYAVSPLDFLPDFIPGVGWADDIALIALAVYMAGDEINAYRVWKWENTDDGEPLDYREYEEVEFECEPEEVESSGSTLDDALDSLNNIGKE